LKAKAVGAIVLVLVIVCVGWLGYWAWYETVVSYHYDTELGDFYDFVSSSNDVPTKIVYMNKFIGSLESLGLDGGQSCMYWQRPDSDLAYHFTIALSLLARLEALNNIAPKSFEYSMSYKQVQDLITCFEHNSLSVYRQAYMLRHGVWWEAVFPYELLSCIIK